MNLFLPLILVRLLSPDQVGVYKIFFLYCSTAPWILMAAGLGNGLYYWAGQNPELKTKAFRTTMTLQSLWSLLIILLGLIAILILSNTQNSLYSLFPNKNYWLLLVFGIALSIPGQFLEESQIASGRTKWAAWYSAGWEAIKTLSMMAIALHFRTSESIVIAFVTVVFAKVVTSLLILIAKKELRLELEKETTTKVLKYAIPASAAAGFLVIINYCDQFILTHFLSAADFAIYSLGCLSVPPLLIFEQSVNKVLVPQMAHEISNNHKNNALKRLRLAMVDLGLWLIPAAIGLFFFAGPITRLLFTNKYPMAESYLQIYAFSYLVFIFPFDAWARSHGRSMWILKTMSAFSVLSLSTTLLGAYFLGAKGALILFIISQFSMRFFWGYSVSQETKTKFTDMAPIGAFLRFATVSILLGLSTRWLCNTMMDNNLPEWTSMILSGSLFLIVYIFICVPWAMKIERKARASKKVLIMTQYLHLGGLEKMILNLAQDLRERTAWQPEVLVYDHLANAASIDSLFIDAKIPLHRWNKKPGFSFKLIFQVIQYCRKNEIDLIHAHDLGPVLYGILIRLFSLGRIRLIFTQHSFVHLQKNWRQTFYEHTFARFTDKICAVSEVIQKRYYSMGFATNQVTLIENGIPMIEPLKNQQAKQELKNQLTNKHFGKNMALKNNSLWLISVARLHPGKGQEEIIHLWSQLPENIRQQCQILIIGGQTENGYEEKLKHLAKQVNDGKDILFLGAQFDPRSWYQAADVFISGSREEGLPLGPLEALSAGLPLILSQIPGHKILQDYSTPFYLNDINESVKIISNLLIRLIEHKNSLDNTNKTNIELSGEVLKLKQRFSLQKMTDSYVNEYEKI